MTTLQLHGIRATVLILLAGSAGCCATLLKSYEPLTVSAVRSAEQRSEALGTMISEEGWTVEPRDRAHREIVAVRVNPDDANLRDRMTVRLETDEIVLAVQTEMLSEGRWWGAPGTCSCCSYARERALAQRLDGNPPPLQLASTR